MNRFKVRKGEEPAFETRWRERDTPLHTVPGFVEFHLLKGPSVTTMCSMRHTRSGSRTPNSRRGPARKPFGNAAPIGRIASNPIDLSVHNRVKNRAVPLWPISRKYSSNSPPMRRVQPRWFLPRAQRRYRILNVQCPEPRHPGANPLGEESASSALD